MNKERNMFYNTYDYVGGNAMPISPMQGMIPNQPNPFLVNNDINAKISNLEKKVKMLESRVSRLENPYNSNNYNEPDNNMYML